MEGHIFLTRSVGAGYQKTAADNRTRHEGRCLSLCSRHKIQYVSQVAELGIDRPGVSNLQLRKDTRTFTPLFSGESVEDQAGRKDTVCQHFHGMSSSRPGGARPGLHKREKVIRCLLRTRRLATQPGNQGSRGRGRGRQGRERPSQDRDR